MASMETRRMAMVGKKLFVSFYCSTVLVFVLIYCCFVFVGHAVVPAADVAPTFEDEDEENGDGIQLAKGYSSSSGPLASSLAHVDRDSLW